MGKNDGIKIQANELFKSSKEMYKARSYKTEESQKGIEYVLSER